MLALIQGTADAAANLWNSETDTTINPHGRQGHEEARRHAAEAGGCPRHLQVRVPARGPFAVLASLPDDLKQSIRQAFLALPTKDKATFDKLSDGKDLGLNAVTLKDYQPIIDMLRHNDEQRKRSS